jgi:uncharacterized CHY-type Zn-finger protein
MLLTRVRPLTIYTLAAMGLDWSGAASWLTRGDMKRNLPQVCGVNVDAQTRCGHYHGVTDIIAIKMWCCGIYYACEECHIELAGHAIEVWPRSEWDTAAIICGACGLELSVRRYMESESHCPECGAGFNPGCRKHYRFYFEVGEE